MTDVPRATLGVARLIWREAEALEIFSETPRVKTLRLRVPGWMGHRPGQHVDVRLTAEDGYQAERSYSVASAPRADLPAREIIELTVERLSDGEVSPYLTDELRPGDRIELRGPIGGYFTWEIGDGGPLALVAGGSGIVPLMAMLRHRAAAAPRVRAVLLHSSRRFEEIIYRKELESMTAEDPNLRVVHTLTREWPENWRGERRRIAFAMLQATLPAPAEKPLLYVCGPTEMVESVATALVDLGHDPARVKTERFGPSGE